MCFASCSRDFCFRCSDVVFNQPAFCFCFRSCNYCCPSYSFASLLLAPSPPSAPICQQEIFPNLGPSASRIGPEALVLVVRKSLDRVSVRQDRRVRGTCCTSRTRCVCWFVYVRTYGTYIRAYAYTYIYVYLYIYRYIFGYLLSFGPGTKETRITLTLSSLPLLVSEEPRFRKMEKSRPF